MSEIIRPITAIAREAVSITDGNREAAVACMKAALMANRHGILDLIATGAIDTIIELQMEKKHGPAQGSA